MSKKIRLGYDILSKRAIETESGVNIDEALKKITSYKKVPGTGDDNHPDEPRPSTKVIYIVKVDGASQPDIYKEWIWNQPVDGVGNWECIGGTSDDANSWKNWSEGHGSSSDCDTSVYIGPDNLIERDDSYVLGQDNVVTVTDETDYSGTDVVEIGSGNAATNAANAYQFGRENTVTGNNLANSENYPHSMAVNIGRNNEISGEGVNIGKDNEAERFGITLGQQNHANDMGIAIGENLKVQTGSVAIGKSVQHSVVLSDFPSLYVNGTYYPIGAIHANQPSGYSFYDQIAFRNGRAVNVHQMDGVVFLNEATKTLYCIPSSYYTYSDTNLGYGYVDDNGTVIITSVIPSGKTGYNFNRLNYVEESSGYRRTTNYIYTKATWGAYVSEWYSTYTKYTYGNNYPIYNNIITNCYAKPGENIVYSWFDNTYNTIIPYINYSILGYYEGNSFIPWFNDNKPAEECEWVNIEFADVIQHSYSATETADLGYTCLAQEVYLAEGGSISLGDLVHAAGGSVAISSGIDTEYSISNPGTTLDIETYTGINDEYSTKSLRYIEYDFRSYPTSTEFRSVLLDNTVTGGSLGLFTGLDTVIKKASNIQYGSFGVGSNISASGQSVMLGENISGAGGCFGVGFGTGLSLENGSIAIASNTKKQQLRYGSILIGSYNSGNMTGGDLVLGNSNKVENSGGVVAVGHSNTVYGGGAYTFGSSATARYGAMTLGFSGPTAEYGAIALSFNGGTAKGGAVAIGFNSPYAENGAIAIGFNSVTAKNSGIALGFEGCTADGGFTIGKWSPKSQYGGFTIGYNSPYSTYGGMVYGFNSANASYGAITVGFDSAKAEGGAITVGLRGTESRYGSIAVGGDSYALARGYTFGEGKYANGGAVAIGYSGTNLGPKNTFQGFFYHTSRWQSYLVDVKLGGISYVCGKDAYDTSGILTPIEDTSGTNHYFKSAVSGKLYKNIEDIPFEDYTVQVKAVLNSSNEYVPYEINPWNYDGSSPSNYIWLDASWGYEEGNIEAMIRHPYELKLNTATSGGFGLGDMYYVADGSLAIASSQFGDSEWSEVPKIQDNSTYKSISAPDGATASIYDTRGLKFCDGNSNPYGFGVYGAYADYDGIAVGTGTRAEYRSTALGHLAKAQNASVAIGYGTKTTVPSYATSESAVIGVRTTAMYRSIALGVDNYASNESWIVGNNNNASEISLGLGKYNKSYNESISIGDYNETNYNAFAIGSRNHVYGWSISMGVNNSTSYVLGGHATLIGYNNQSFSDMETRTWEDTSSSTTYYLPLNSYYDYSWSEQIYTPDEIGPSGYIGSLSFCVSSYSTTRYLNIYLANTTKNSFTGNNDWVLSSSATLVFSGYVTFNVGWNTIQLNTSFQYDDSKNLCVIVLDNTGSYSSSMYFKGMSPGDGVYRSMYAYRDGSSYNPSSSSTSGALTDNRPFIRFLIGGSTVSVPKIVPLSGSIPTNSILMGALNESNHYNSILIGVGNQSDSPHIIRDDNHYNTDDDDGFMIAIGRENYVGRNYDIAIGYKSVAYGGENIAIQHSTAKGFGNIALEQSSIAYGVRNFAMFDSSLETNSSGTEIKFNKDVLANILVDASLTGASNIRRNTVMHTNMDTSASSTERNIIHIGVRKTTEYDDGHTVHVINAPTFNDNIMIGARMGTKVPFSNDSDITLSGGGWAMDRNVLLNNAYALLSSGGGGCCDNTCISAELYIDTVYYVHDNFISNSLCQVAAPYYTLAANAFMARSEVTGSNHSYSIDRNFVFASYMHCTPDSTVSHRTSISDITSNVLFGSTASMVQRCFSFSNSYNNAGGDSAYLEYACGVVNFGDANIYDTSDVFSFGDDNEYHRIKKGVIMGNMNTVDANTEIARVTLIGNDNTIKATYGSDTAGGPLVLGDSNNILHGKFVFDNRILGNNNYIANYVGLQKWTEQEINSITSVDYPRIFAPVHRCIRVTGTMTFLWRDMYCYYYNHSISYSYSAPSEPYTSMTASAFSTAYQNGTLTNDSFYFITTNASSLPSMASGDFMDDNAVYHIEENSTYVRELSPDDKLYSVAKTGVFSTEDAHNASRNLIIGDSNGAYSNTVGYSILGSGNIVRNTQVSSEYKAYAISNGFVQGNNNVVTDGSNIIAMGNGHVATGHNSVAIGSQLISDQWQTVLGKYNEPISGPDRLADPADEADKALLIVGNGYSDTDGDDWQDETQIHRSNAMVVYANGDTVFSGNVNAANLPPAPSNDGRYALNCIVTNGVPSYSWVPVGTVTV